MTDTLHNNLIRMVQGSRSPMILADKHLEVLAYSRPFQQSVVSFSGDLHTLFDANALQRIKRSRTEQRSIQIRTKTAPFVLNMNINWLSTDENNAYMIGVVESNSIHDANRSLTIAYACTDLAMKTSDLMLSSLYNLHEHQKMSENVTKMLLDDARRINRTHFNLKHHLDILTDSLVLDKRDNNITRIVKLCAQQHQEKAKDRNIRILTTLPKLSCFSPCDMRYFTMAISDCLAFLLSFTQDNHTLTVEMKSQYPEHEIIFRDPVFQIPERYIEGLFTGDITLPNKEHLMGLYFPYTVIGKHNGTLTLDQSDKIGYSLRLTLPATPPNHLIFEDVDDSLITKTILHYIDLAATDI